MGDESVQRLIADTCLAGESDDLESRARRHGVSPGDLAVLSAAPQRLTLYRRLVRNNLLGVTSRMMPRTRTRVNDPTDGAFDRAFDAFLATAAPRTHYLRDVPAEFLAWAAPRWIEDARVPRYAADLAGFELVHFQIAAAPPLENARAATELALDRRLVFCPARKLVRYAHAVHLLPDDPDDRTEPVVRPTRLVAYRDPNNTVRFLELTALAAAMVERLFAGEVLRAAIATACESEGTPLTPEVLHSTASLLADWGARGLLLGAAS